MRTTNNSAECAILINGPRQAQISILTSLCIIGDKLLVLFYLGLCRASRKPYLASVYRKAWELADNVSDAGLAYLHKNIIGWHTVLKML